MAGASKCGNGPSDSPKMRGISCLAADMSASEDGLCCMELLSLYNRMFVYS